MSSATAQFVKLPTAILSRRDLPSTAKLVFADIVDRMGNKGTAWPGIRRIAQDLGISENAVLRAIVRLEGTGLLTVNRPGSGMVNTYRLPETVVETATVKGPRPSSKRLRKRCRNGYGSKQGGVAETEVSVAETATEALPKRLQNQTDPITRALTCGGGVRTTKKIADDIAAYWNSKSKRPKIKKLSKGRRSKIAARLKDPGFAEGWRDAIDRIEASDFCNGGGERGWTAGFDWLIANDVNWLKVAEGKYDNHGSGVSTDGRPTDAAPNLDHPTIEDARRRWPDDVREHLAEYRAIAETVERGDLSSRVVKDSAAANGPEFRRDILKGAAHATG